MAISTDSYSWYERYRTPFLADGIKVIQHAGFTPVIRNAGGLGIISDQGILNISLIFPQEDENRISIDEGYEKMLALTRQAFPVYADKIEAYEIKEVPTVQVRMTLVSMVKNLPGLPNVALKTGFQS